jgi:hypothetical protein
MGKDKNMSVASLGSTKRAASPHMDRATKQQSAQFKEPEVNKSKVSTKANRNTANPFLETLTETVLKLTKTRYTKLFRNDKGDPSPFHDNLQLIIGYARR